MLPSRRFPVPFSCEVPGQSQSVPFFFSIWPFFPQQRSVSSIFFSLALLFNYIVRLFFSSFELAMVLFPFPVLTDFFLFLSYFFPLRKPFFFFLFGWNGIYDSLPRKTRSLSSMLSTPFFERPSWRLSLPLSFAYLGHGRHFFSFVLGIATVPSSFGSDCRIRGNLDRSFSPFFLLAEGPDPVFRVVFGW